MYGFMLEGSVFDGKKTRSQCLGTGMTRRGHWDDTLPSWDDKKKRYWYDIKRVGVDGKKKHRRHSASFFVIPVRDTGIQGHIDRCRQFVIPLRVSGI
ncbi:hypothetical protein ACJZL1_02785 [Wolbachia endosymbiont of Rhagoletis indifferens]|uniref:hypothetical protein n=1 Tax=Wolbachia endosymbiont of Rhagoletis indifferens TaxID=3383250 RepID=UPI003AF3CE03